jgi:hypothetical protein
MALWEAASWGAIGGGAVVLLNFGGDLVRSSFRWPWPRNEVGPRLVYAAIQLLLGSLVTAANHSQVTGAWPAFIIGISAPAVVQGIVARVEVARRDQTKPAPKGVESPARADAADHDE